METKRFEIKATELRAEDVIVSDPQVEQIVGSARLTVSTVKVGGKSGFVYAHVTEIASGKSRRISIDPGKVVVVERQVQTAEERRGELARGIRRTLWGFLETFEARRAAFATDFEANPVHAITWNAEPLAEAQVLAESAQDILTSEGRGFDLFETVADARKRCLQTMLRNAGQSQSSSTASNLAGEATLRAAARFLESYLLSEEALASVSEEISA